MMNAVLPWLVAVPAWAGVAPATESSDAVWESRRVAVVIGVQDYSDPTLQGLRFPAKDAADLGAVLRAPNIGGFDEVFVVSGAAATTADAIRHAISVATADLQRDDTFFLYLSGHGTLTLDAREGSRLWFLPSDSRLDAPESTGIAIAELEAIVNSQPARRRVLVLDTCHNGRNTGSLAGRSALNDPTSQLLAGLRGEAPAPRGLRAVSESEARLFAAQYHQPAMEDPALENGVYTHFLIDALTTGRAEADLDRDGLVDVAEAHDHARDHTIQHTGGMQVPRAEYRIVGHEEIYLAGDPSRRDSAEQALITACDEVLAKARLWVDGQPRGVMPGLTPVDPGRHRIELQDGDGRTLAKQTVYLDAGENLSVETLLDADRQSRLGLVVGAVAQTGEASPWFHPVSPELELQWLDPVSFHPAFRAALHVRGGGWRGTVAEQADDVGALPVSAGSAGIGASLGGRWRNLSLGPEVELLVPWRIYEDYSDITQAMPQSHRQAQVTPAAGLRLLWTPTLGQQSWTVRIDSRQTSVLVDTSRLPMWHHSVAVGWTPKPRR